MAWVASVELAYAVAVLQSAIGLGLWALGFRVFRLFVVVTGAAVGFAAGLVVLDLAGATDAAPWVGGLGAIAGGLVAWPLRRTVVFVAGAALGFVPTYLMLAAGRIDGIVGATAPIVAGALVGALALRFDKFFVILATSLAGGLSMVGAGYVWAGQGFPAASGRALVTLLVAGAGIGILGVPLQYTLLRRRKPETAKPAIDLHEDPEPDLPAGAASGIRLVRSGADAPASTLGPASILRPSSALAAAAPRQGPLRCPSCATALPMGTAHDAARCPNVGCGFWAPVAA